jgi:hypothetical protein
VLSIRLCVRAQASLRSHCRPPITQRAGARARVGERSRTESSLGNTNENVVGRQVGGEYLKDIMHGERVEHLRHGDIKRED